MTCPVCGLPDAGTPCPRCGTDLAALAGEPVRLEITSVAPKPRVMAGVDPSF